MLKENADLTGQTFGQWTALERDTERTRAGGQRRTRWLCRCGGCQKVHSVVAGNLIRGYSSACLSCAAKANMLKRWRDDEGSAGKRCRYCPRTGPPDGRGRARAEGGRRYWPMRDICPACARQIERNKSDGTGPCADCGGPRYATRAHRCPT